MHLPRSLRRRRLARRPEKAGLHGALPAQAGALCAACLLWKSWIKIRLVEFAPEAPEESRQLRHFGWELIFKEVPLHIDAFVKGFYKWGLVRSMESEFSIHHP